MPYLSPATTDEALALLARGRPVPVAGGTDFFPAQRPGAQARDILDLTRIQGLRGITREGGSWRIGAATTWTDIVRADLPPAFDALKAAAREVGSVQIQNAGTVAGNICNASPAADGMPPLLALDTEVEIASLSGPRRLPLSQFVTGVRRTALQPGELVTALHVPAPADGTGSAFEKLGSRRYLVISIVMVAANVTLRDGHIAQAQVAVGSCSPVAQRLPALERRLAGLAPADLRDLAIAAQDLAPLSPIDDVRGSAGYRIGAVGELCRRALIRAAAGATDG